MTLPIGTRVRVHARNIESLTHKPFNGATGTVVAERRAGEYVVKFDDPKVEAAQRVPSVWTTKALDVLVPLRPTVDFSDAHKDRSKARAFAAAADSRVLRAEARTVLRAAAAGEEVDAYDLNAALIQAMSAAATRYGQSMQRRDLTSKIRHLAYITQGVIENHADNLPAYEAGERSRKVVALEEEVAKLRQEGSDLRSSAKAEVDRLTTEVNKYREEAKHATKALDEVASVLVYAIERLTEEERHRVLGFWDGITTV